MPSDLERIIQNLLGRGVEDRSLEYKGRMEWRGSRPQKLEIVKDIVCLANTRGGHILVGVEETDHGFTPVGLSSAEQASFDQTQMANLAREHFAPGPVFVVRKAAVNGMKFVLIDVSEFGDVPIVCSRDSAEVVRRGAIYMRTDDPTCEEIRSSDQMRVLVDRAVTKRGDSLLRQIADLMSQTDFPVGGDSGPAPQFEPELAEALSFLDAAGPQEPYWQVTLLPAGEPVSLSRPDLRRAVSRSKVEMRGWDFPHFDDRVIVAFEDGEESVFSWRFYTEAFRALRDGAFVWRGRTTEEFTEDGAVDLVSVIFTVTEFVAFAAEYADHAYSQHGLTLVVEATGLAGRRLQTQPGHQLYQEHIARVGSFRVSRQLGYAELRVSYPDVARDFVREFFELFNWYDSAESIARWQQRLLNRELWP